MDNIMKDLLKFGIEHPARVMDFSDLTKGLFAEVENGNVNVGYHPDFPHLAIFKYSLNCIMERNWNTFTLISRGLILDLKNKKVIATPFIKFFNYGELEAGSKSIIEPEFTVTEKMDGSLGIMFYYEDKFRFATAGSFISEQAAWAEMWANEKMPLDKIDKTNTYLFEIIYYANKIVVDYDFEGLVLLSIYDSYGLEYNYEQIKWESSYMNVHHAAQYDFKDMNSILDTAKTLSKDNEGYVIRFKSGMRIKIKGEEYVRIHRILSKVTPLAIWDAIVAGDDLIEVRLELPEEMEKDFDKIIYIYEQNLRSFIKEVTVMYEKSKIFSDKELAEDMEQNPNSYKSETYKTPKNYIFMMRNCNFYPALRDYGSFTRRRIFKSFRPKSNVLEGYTPSSLVDRFTNT
jgi:RNA ligase